MAVEVSKQHIEVLPVEVEEQLQEMSQQGLSYLNFPQELFDNKVVKMRAENFEANENGLTTCKLNLYGYMDEARNLVPASEGYEGNHQVWRFKTGKVRVESLAQFMSEQDWETFLERGQKWVEAGDDWDEAKQHAVPMQPLDGESSSALQFIPAPGISNGRDGDEERPIWIARSPVFNEIQVFGGGTEAQAGVDDSRGCTVKFGQAKSKPQSPKQSPKQPPQRSPIANRSRRGRKTGRSTVKPKEQPESDIPE